MNQSDSERIITVLEDLGYKKVEDINSANLVILNTCSVRASAESRVLGLIRNIKKAKKRVKIGITGCMIHIRPDKLEKAGSDYIFDIKDLLKLPEILKINPYRQVSSPSQQISNPSQQQTASYFKINSQHSSKHHAYIPIMTGCNNFCTYCVVPYARAREKSRPSEEIIKEVKELVKNGYKAFTLLGQNVNSYGNDIENEIKFPKLLYKIAEIPGNFWIWFVTSHPKDMSNELIKVIKSKSKICNYIHLPVQAGSNKVLKNMNRKYTREDYLKLVRKIKNNIKDVSLSTDIIVGFPGETRQDFQDTVDIFKKAKFDMAYIARYSPRPKTAAFKLKDSVSNLEKKRRDKALVKLLENNALQFNKKLVGKTLEVFIENKIKDNIYIGKTKTSKTVKIKSSKPASQIIGKILKAEIKEADNFGLKGILL